MALKKQYAKSQETAVVSYSYTDISERTGVVSFLGFTHKEDTTLGYAIGQSSIYSNDVYTGNPADSATFIKVSDLDFDLTTFNLPARIRGTATLTFTFGGGAHPPSADGDAYIIAKLRHWDGTTETEIANAQSETLSWASEEIKWKTVNIQIAISTLQSFKSGDTLRVTMEAWGKQHVQPGQDPTIYLLHDPKNRVSSTDVPQTAGEVPITSVMQVDIPFLLDL